MFRHEADFNIVHGDIADDELDIYQPEKQMMGVLEIPRYRVPVNHDVNYKFQTATEHFAIFKKAYSSDNYSTNHANEKKNIDNWQLGPANPSHLMEIKIASEFKSGKA